jgi:hypothetical protein
LRVCRATRDDRQPNYPQALPRPDGGTSKCKTASLPRPACPSLRNGRHGPTKVVRCVCWGGHGQIASGAAPAAPAHLWGETRRDPPALRRRGRPRQSDATERKRAKTRKRHRDRASPPRAGTPDRTQASRTGRAPLMTRMRPSYHNLSAQDSIPAHTHGPAGSASPKALPNPSPNPSPNPDPDPESRSRIRK